MGQSEARSQLLVSLDTVWDRWKKLARLVSIQNTVLNSQTVFASHPLIRSESDQYLTHITDQSRLRAPLNVRLTNENTVLQVKLTNHISGSEDHRAGGRGDEPAARDVGGPSGEGGGQ